MNFRRPQAKKIGHFTDRCFELLPFKRMFSIILSLNQRIFLEFGDGNYFIKMEAASITLLCLGLGLWPDLPVRTLNISSVVDDEWDVRKGVGSSSIVESLILHLLVFQAFSTTNIFLQWTNLTVTIYPTVLYAVYLYCLRN